MRLIGKLFLALTILLFVAGAFILLGDGLFTLKYGVDYHDAAFVTTNGDFADWPTGERPGYAHLPAWAYGLAAWFAAANNRPSHCLTHTRFLLNPRTEYTCSSPSQKPISSSRQNPLSPRARIRARRHRRRIAGIISRSAATTS